MNKENFGKTEVFVYFSDSIANSVDQQCGLPGWARRFTQKKTSANCHVLPCRSGQYMGNFPRTNGPS